MKLIPLIRQSKDIGIFGKKGVGKTTILSLLGFLEWYFYNTVIYSNFHVNYPHIRVRNRSDFDKIPNDNRRKKFLGDDFEFWFSSYESINKKTKHLNEVILNWGKKNTSLTYTAKREMGIQKSLRESTIEFWELSLKPLYKHPDAIKNNELKGYLNFLYIYVSRFDENIDPLPSYKIKNLDKMAILFNTKEIIEELKDL